VPLNFTAEAEVKFAPAMLTFVPTGPLVGEKLEMVGAGAEPVTVKLVALVTMPPPAITAIGPVEAPVGTVAVILMSELMVKEALRPLKVTLAAVVKPEPLMVTPAPTAPLPGEKLVRVGALEP